MVDATRKLKIPNWYAPYLEKNRIYELFHELVRELVIQKPEDHILFLREILQNASQSRYAPRIMLLVPPLINKYELASLIAKNYNVCVLTEKTILTALCKDGFSRGDVSKVIKCLSVVLRSSDIYYSGWILPDFPKTYKEAKQMQQAGILPSHVFHLIPPYQDSLYKVNPEKDSESWIIYRCNLLGVINTFKNNIKEIYIGDKKIEEIAEECANLINIKKRYKAPVIPRICLLGPRGSGRRTQAKLIVKTFNCVHVDFENLLCQTWKSDTHLGQLLRACKDRAGENSLLLSAMIHKRILKADCLQYGWVLTGFPNTLEDFKNFDMLDTPPNRVIFLECDFNVCRQRVMRRRVNICTGSVTNIDKITPSLDEIIKIHPKDNEDNITAEINFYCRNYEEIRKYCGRTAYIVDANQPLQFVGDCIASILMQPLPDAESRSSVYIPDDIDSQSDQCSCESQCFFPNQQQT